MAKLYEILAVDKDLSKEAATEMGRVLALFGSDGTLIGRNVSFHVILEGEPEMDSEVQLLAHTVQGELEEMQEKFGDYVDVTIQKEVTNSVAKATVELEGKEFLGELSATALLNLESRLDDLRRLYETIPTINTSERWTFSEEQGCFVSATRSTIRGKKVPRNHVLAEATPEHPAQVQVYHEDVPAYKVETVLLSGMITPADKAERLARLAKLAKAVKQARQRANDVEIVETKVANKIFDYVDHGVINL